MTHNPSRIPPSTTPLNCNISGVAPPGASLFSPFPITSPQIASKPPYHAQPTICYIGLDAGMGVDWAERLESGLAGEQR